MTRGLILVLLLGLRAEEKERCMKDLRAASSADDKRQGPEATGAASGATSATPGTAAPR